MDSRKFIYPKKIWYRISDFSSILYSMVFFLVGIIFFYTLILNNDIFFAIIYLFGFSVWTPFFFLSNSFLFADVELLDEGLLIKFIFKSLFVKWEDIVVIKPARFLGITRKPSASLLVVNAGLTLFHCIYGLAYGQTAQPAFLITSRIANYEELMILINKNIKTEKKKRKHLSDKLTKKRN